MLAVGPKLLKVAQKRKWHFSHNFPKEVMTYSLVSRYSDTNYTFWYVCKASLGKLLRAYVILG